MDINRIFNEDNFVDIDDDIDEIEKIREECANSILPVARNCIYSRNDIETKLNNNLLVVGGSGTGKTRGVVEPNLMESKGSVLVCAPKGGFAKKYGEKLRRRGYRIIELDFVHPEKSMHYNPLAKEKMTTQEIQTIANTIVYDTDSVSAHDPFWDTSSMILCSALLGYMNETDYEPKNFHGLLELVREGERYEYEGKDSKLAERFKQLKRINPNSLACQKFEDANSAPSKTYDCIRVSLMAKFATLDTEEIQAMMSGNDVDFKQIAREKTAAFVTASDTNRSMDVLTNLFFTQAMQELCDFADNDSNECGDGRLPIPVNFILDDFATICRIDEFPRMISSIRSRGISAILMIQSEAQLKRSYGYDYLTIIANCDTYAYLGGNDVETAKAVGERCNKPMNRVLAMPIGNCYVFRRGEEPVYTKLLDLEKYIREDESR